MTDEQLEIDAQIMVDIEERIDIQEWAADDFRRNLGAFFGYMLAKGMPVYWDSNPLLKKAILSKVNDGS
jgi:predicted Ser/Thr protein kinase